MRTLITVRSTHPNRVWSTHPLRMREELLDLDPDLFAVWLTEEDVAAFGPLPIVYEVIERPPVAGVP